MGLFNKIGNFLGGRPSSSAPVEIPGVIGRPEAAKFLRQGVQAAGQPSAFNAQIQSILNPPASSFNAPLRSAILNPQFTAQTGAQQELINQILAQRQGQFNALGIGSAPGTQAAVAAAAAPALVQFQQQHIGNLAGGRELELGEQQQQANIVLSVLANELDRRGINVQALLSAATEGRVGVGTAQKGARKGLLDFLSFSGPTKGGGTFGVGG